LTAEASVATDRAGRYLVQLCRHVNLAARAHPQMRARAEWSDDRGVISFSAARCTLRAEPGVLRLRAEAPDEPSLRELEQRVAERLAQVGRRDRLTVTWTPPSHSIGEPVPSSSDDGMRYEDDSRPGVPRWVKVAGIVAAVLALLVVIALLVGGGGGHGPSRHF
jgi:uncharacterized protein